jgi:hypothetical protein
VKVVYAVSPGRGEYSTALVVAHAGWGSAARGRPRIQSAVQHWPRCYHAECCVTAEECFWLRGGSAFIRSQGMALHGAALTDAELESFWADGFVRLGHVAPPEEVEALRRRADEILLGEVSYQGMTFMLDPSAVDLTARWQEALQSHSVLDAVKQLRTLKYRKVQGFEHDPMFLR